MTEAGRLLLDRIVEGVARRNWGRVLYGATDSAFVLPERAEGAPRGRMLADRLQALAAQLRFSPINSLKLCLGSTCKYIFLLELGQCLARLGLGLAPSRTWILAHFFLAHLGPGPFERRISKHCHKHNILRTMLSITENVCTHPLT